VTLSTNCLDWMDGYMYRAPMAWYACLPAW
jgi:hypothetical protein